jgi:hypothetical protein
MSPLIALPLCVLFAWFFYPLALDMWDGGCNYLWLYRVASVLSLVFSALLAALAVGLLWIALRFKPAHVLVLSGVVAVPAAMISWFVIRAWIHGGRCSFCGRRAPRLQKTCPHGGFHQ